MMNICKYNSRIEIHCAQCKVSTKNYWRGTSESIVFICDAQPHYEYLWWSETINKQLKKNFKQADPILDVQIRNQFHYIVISLLNSILCFIQSAICDEHCA